MALRAIKRRATGSNTLDLATTFAKLVSDVTNLLQFPPAAAAASIMLAILETVKDVKSNQQDCNRLSRRAARLLVDVGKRMDGKWDDAPKALIENVHEFERTLIRIQEFMQNMAQTKWVNRLLSKSSIEDALADFSCALEDAARSFQIASLIDIHYAIGSIQSRMSATITDEYEVIEDPGPTPVYQKKSTESQSLTIMAAPFTASPISSPRLLEYTHSLGCPALINVDEDNSALIVQDSSSGVELSFTEVDEFMADLTDSEDEFGFRRYHQSEVRLRKTVRSTVGWFSGMSHATVNDQKIIVKKYDGPKEQAMEQWMKDIKMLRNLYHESLPQLMGYSDGKTSTPFILLAPVQFRDINLHMQSVLQTQDLASCAVTILRMFRDISSAALYIQQQLNLDDEKAQDFIEHATYTIDSENNVLLGLPKPRQGNWVTFRSYNLTETIVDRVTKYLSDLERLGNNDSEKIAPKLANKLRQLAPLVRALLPDRTTGPALEPALEALLDEDESTPIPLTVLRRAGLRRKRHDQYWRARAPANSSLRIGDFGCLPTVDNFEKFTPLGNVFDLGAETSHRCRLATAKETSGSQMRLVGGVSRQEPMRPFLLPPHLEGWPLALMPQSQVTVFLWRQERFESVNDTWEYLLENARGVAEAHGIAPHELVLITRTAIDQNYTVRDWSARALPLPGHATFHHQHPGGHGNFGNAGPMPTIVYLFTSADPAVGAYCTDDPSGTPRPREMRSTSWTYSCSSGGRAVT